MYNQISHTDTTVWQPEAASTNSGLAITIFDGINAPRKIDLTSFGKHIITFGRDPSCDIVINSPLVSRKHGVFKVFEHGTCIIEDMGSSNGLYCCGKRIKNKKLLIGDSIRIDSVLKTTSEGVLINCCEGGSDIVWRSYPVYANTEITIGRSPNCNIVLDHVSVSKLHAKITVTGNAAFISDNNSTNGVIVNGRKVTGKVRLHEKDVILITNSQLIFSFSGITYCCFRSGISVIANNIVKRVGKKYLTICNNVSLCINPCELVAIIGGSGAGKSSIMNCISGLSIPTSGAVFINQTNLYGNYEALKNIIGYVPQSDIVYDNLTVYNMLMYTAKLRLPKDTSAAEMRTIIYSVIQKVELTAQSNTLIKNLSGGQRKRASIAVELISDPNLFFLDEPASGLDPGTERNLMKTLKNMTMSGKTVVLVTHSTLNLHMCDKIVFMGKGGNLCFCGSYDDALRFFGVTDITDVYNMITEYPEQWRDHYYSTQNIAGNTNASFGTKKLNITPAKSAREQLPVLISRCLKLTFADKQRLLLILLQAPLLAILISFVADGEQFEQYEMTKSLLFALSCSAFWIGTLNSIQEICKERSILKREYMTGLRLNAYVISKMVVLGIICTIQTLLICTVFFLIVGTPVGVFDGGAIPEMIITVFLTAMAASAMGILVSAMFKNADRAMTVAPLLLMPQLLFSGMIFTLEGATETISYFAVCRWSMEGLGTCADLNSLDTRLQQEGINIEHVFESFYDFSASHMVQVWLILIFFIVILPMIATFILKRLDRDRI